MKVYGKQVKYNSKRIKRSNMDYQLFDAIEQNDIKKVKGLISQGADVNFKNMKDQNHGLTPLHWCIYHDCSLDIMEYLVESKADVNIKSNIYGWASLYWAVDKNNLDAVKYLIGKGADIYAKDKKGRTPLDIADQNNKSEIIKFLVKKLAEQNERLPLHWTVENCSLKAVKLFIDNDSINAKDRDGKTPLHLAAKTGRSEIAKLLMDNRADINATDTSSWAPLHKTAGKNNATEGQLNVAKLLISKHANINAKNDKGYTPLHLAAKKGNLNIAEFLVNTNGIDIEARSRIGNTPLHIAAKSNKLEVVKFLTDKRAKDSSPSSS